MIVQSQQTCIIFYKLISLRENIFFLLSQIPQGWPNSEHSIMAVQV